MLFRSYAEVELALTEALGRKVNVAAKRNKGMLQIEFYDEEDLGALAKRLSGEDR